MPYAADIREADADHTHGIGRFWRNWFTFRRLFDAPGEDHKYGVVLNAVNYNTSIEP